MSDVVEHLLREYIKIPSVLARKNDQIFWFPFHYKFYQPYRWVEGKLAISVRESRTFWLQYSFIYLVTGLGTIFNLT